MIWYVALDRYVCQIWRVRAPVLGEIYSYSRASFEAARVLLLFCFLQDRYSYIVIRDVRREEVHIEKEIF